MEERIVKFKDVCGYEDIYVKTNAPSYEIEDAIAYRQELVEQFIEQDCEEDCGFNAIANYLTQRGFTFEEVEEDCEEYWW